ncbi:MAG: serine/threonine-protein kinase [Archangium sp.]|nr:serine/threonine-protein kinase [Archangium sp.]
MPQTSVSNRGLKPVSFREEKTVLPVRTHDVLLGRYRLEDKIGEGGMGTVFIAHDSELDRKVAVKLLAAALVNDAEVLERFEREARLTAKLDHPNIIPIYDVGRHEGRPFIVMKLLQGDSLVGRLRAKGGFTADETLKLMRQLALGLDYLHGQGFIHRDIKAANIFVSPEGLATILDFGILRQKSATTGITRTGMVMGTPHYMAPEQALGLKDVDHRVDLYALAVVLFECLTGTLPFEADSELRLIQLQAHAPVPEILDRAPWIPRPVADVVKKALSKKPDDRYNTAAELVAALEAAYLEAKSSKSSLPVVSGPVPQVPTSTAPSLRKLQSSKVSSAALPVVAGKIDPSTGELSAALHASRRPWALLGVLVLAVVGTGLYFALRPDEGPVVIAPMAPVDAGVAAVAAIDDAATDFAAFPDAAVVQVAEGLDAGAEEPEVDAGTMLAVEPNPVIKKQPGKKKGRVNVITTHGGEPYWAQVSIDGVPRGRTPLLLDLPVGRYQVLIERPGFRSLSREIRVAGGRAVVVRLELVP